MSFSSGGHVDYLISTKSTINTIHRLFLSQKSVGSAFFLYLTQFIIMDDNYSVNISSKFEPNRSRGFRDDVKMDDDEGRQ